MHGPATTTASETTTRLTFARKDLANEKEEMERSVAQEDDGAAEARRNAGRQTSDGHRPSLRATRSPACPSMLLLRMAEGKPSMRILVFGGRDYPYPAFVHEALLQLTDGVPFWRVT